MKSILVADDNLDFLTAIKLALGTIGQVTSARSLSEIRNKYLSQTWDLILLDYDLSDGNGYEAASELRLRSPKAPLFIISGIMSKDIAIQGFAFPIDGILEKPFEFSSLMTQLNHLKWFNEELVLDNETRSLCSATRVWSLTDTEFKILNVIREAEQPVSREEIERRVWPNSNFSKNVFDTHFYNLKQKVPPLRDRIKSLRGRGYLWIDST